MIEQHYLPTLHDFPYPWNTMDTSLLYTHIDTLSPSDNHIAEAFFVLHKCLHLLTTISELDTTSLPDDWLEIWNLTNQNLLKQYPTFQQFDRKMIKQFVAERLSDATSQNVEEITAFVLRGRVEDNVEAILKWFSQMKRHTTDKAFKTSLINIITRYFYQVDEHLAQAMLRHLTFIADHDALPFLNQVANNPNVDPDLRQDALSRIDYIHFHSSHYSNEPETP